MNDYRNRPPVDAPILLRFDPHLAIIALCAWIAIGAIGVSLAVVFGLIG